ncbi:MAG: right-handed parallel beta-helix repeat-containing protein, partial [bacterium]
MGISSGTITNCIAEYNGGGFVALGPTTITGCTAAYNSGSGFAITYGTVDHCVSQYNATTQGAGMRVQGDATVTHCAIIGNTASQEAGGVYAGTGSPSFVDCLFMDNSCNTRGGGIFAGFGSGASVTNCLFLGNHSGFAGGGWHSMEGCNGRLTNVTFYGNTAESGGAIGVDFGCPEIHNTVAWGNGADPVANAYGGTPTFYHSLIEGSGGSGAWDSAFGTDGGGNIDGDPLFVDAPGGNVRLSLESPVIDAGNNAAPNVTATDYDGNPRIVGAAIDMGAFEFACPAASRIFVDAVATGAESGASWTDAFTTLQQALAVACDNVTEIWVADGTYTPTGGDNRDATYQLRSGLTVYGGFAGGENTLSERDIGANAAVLSGEIGSSSPMDNVYHVVTGSGTDSTAILDGFTVTGGYASGTYPDDRGGG